MTARSPQLLEALADCLSAGDSVDAALVKVGSAGPAARQWTERVRRVARQEARLAEGLHAARLIDDAEAQLLSMEGAELALPPLLRTLASRRRRFAERRAVLVGAVIGPFFLCALTVVLDPLPNLVNGGDVLVPALRGLFLLAAGALAVVLGVGALFRHPRARPALLRAASRVPGPSWLVGLHVEEELALAVSMFALPGAQETPPEGLRAAAVLLAWSPVGARLAASAREPGARTPSAMAGLDPVAGLLSVDTNLVIVGGAASGELGPRLAARSERLAATLTRRLRAVVRVAAYGALVVLSIASVARMVTRGLPGLPSFPGGAASGEQKELEDLLKQLDQP